MREDGRTTGPTASASLQSTLLFNAANIPVIATDACGLRPQPGLTLVGRDDTSSLWRALIGVMEGARAQVP